MAVMTQIPLPVSYEQFQAIDRQINPERVVPPGRLKHIVSRHEGGVMITTVWQDEGAARTFYQAAAQKLSMPVPPVTFTEIFEILP